MQFNINSTCLLAPLIAYFAVCGIFPPFVLAKGSSYRWPDVELSIHSKYCNKTLEPMTTHQCTLSNVMNNPRAAKDSDVKSSLILYNSNCTEIGRKDNVGIRDSKVEINSSLPKPVTIDSKNMGPGNQVSFSYGNYSDTEDDFKCYLIAMDVNKQQIKACSAVFDCPTDISAISAANAWGLKFSTLFLGVSALVVAILIG